eukprot:NODE_176_length_1885_cov_279.973770.p2 GENE.NODE_176_length_1885_cov_279.973770~~NODE_176_length_1885_cov_279.973770.p2  ORF type:complete len:142 (+),score=0.24 NODE_176_length_1885_cov_279.973770:852-1277(+)
MDHYSVVPGSPLGAPGGLCAPGMLSNKFGANWCITTACNALWPQCRATSTRMMTPCTQMQAHGLSTLAASPKGFDPTKGSMRGSCTKASHPEHSACAGIKHCVHDTAQKPLLANFGPDKIWSALADAQNADGWQPPLLTNL